MPAQTSVRGAQSHMDNRVLLAGRLRVKGHSPEVSRVGVLGAKNRVTRE